MATLGVPRWSYAKGVHEVGNGVYAYLQPDGSWGWSNAGLVVDGDRSLLVDTLFDLALTREMLAALRDAAPRATARFDTLVNTHANGDHCHGNELVEGAEIIASAAAAEEMAAEGPEVLAAFKKAAPQMGAAGEFFLEAFGPFEFEGIAKTLPTRTFTGELSLAVGDRRVDLVEVGPCHTRGDVLVHGGQEWAVPWKVGIAHPFAPDAVALVLQADDLAVASSSSTARPSCGPARSRTGSRPATACSRWTSRRSCPATGRSRTRAACAPCATPSSTCATRRRRASTRGWASSARRSAGGSCPRGSSTT